MLNMAGYYTDGALTAHRPADVRLVKPVDAKSSEAAEGFAFLNN